jgi:hypothetical protein
MQKRIVKKGTENFVFAIITLAPFFVSLMLMISKAKHSNS